MKLESNNETTTCADKDKQTPCEYCIKVKENTLSTSENKEKARDGYVCIYECGKTFCTSTSERTCAAQETTTVQIKENLESLNS